MLYDQKMLNFLVSIIRSNAIYKIQYTKIQYTVQYTKMYDRVTFILGAQQFSLNMFSPSAQVI